MRSSDLIVDAKMNISIISAMGAGNKLDPTLFQIAEFSGLICGLLQKSFEGN